MSLIETLRGPRIGPFSVFDSAGTAVIAYWIARWFEWPVLPTVAASFVLGEVVHVAVGVETPGTKMLTQQQEQKDT